MTNCELKYTAEIKACIKLSVYCWEYSLLFMGSFSQQQHTIHLILCRKCSWGWGEQKKMTPCSVWFLKTIFSLFIDMNRYIDPEWGLLYAQCERRWTCLPLQLSGAILDPCFWACRVSSSQPHFYQPLTAVSFSLKKLWRWVCTTCICWMWKPTTVCC